MDTNGSNFSLKMIKRNIKDLYTMHQNCPSLALGAAKPYALTQQLHPVHFFTHKHLIVVCATFVPPPLYRKEAPFRVLFGPNPVAAGVPLPVP